ncbi:FimD/PapC C-terminal domain-containing protein [Variovorax sp. 54]|uniref:FimD/PapC C-terminal domain-containing protein n=1 Tax=Variovorax sp. 54 TaxID=2035212 RepID=UPI000C174278|nr:FimD/PapC C-terminal domain-containing protein [Variovorax sp. 54]
MGGARVTNASGLRIGPWGQAVVSNLAPFASNEVELDPKGLPMSVELKSSTQRVAPTAGAVVKLKFETSGGGRSVLVRVTLADGTPVPFGARVTDADGQEVGTVGQDGRLLLRSVMGDAMRYELAWGEGGDQRCRLPLVLHDTPADDSVPGRSSPWRVIDARCVM